MRKEDFVFDHIDAEFEDYWFKVTGDTKQELTDQYMEMCMVEVADVVYSCKDNIVGVKRLFPFNYDVIMSDDQPLMETLKSIVQSMKG